jgi:hypothetical protein
MKRVLVLTKTYLPATNCSEIKGLFLAAKDANIRIPEDHLPAGIYSGIVAETLNYLHPYIWKDDEGRHLKMTLACILINHQTGEIEEFGPLSKNRKEFHIRKQDSLLMTSGCHFEVYLNEKGFIAKLTIMDDQEKEVTPTSC